jgi:hypothetical protein
MFRTASGLKIIYSDLPAFERFRTPFLASLNNVNGEWQISDDGPFQKKTIATEKNWIPFTYVDDAQQENLLLIYSAQPHRIFKVHDTKALVYSEFSKCDRKLKWKWGAVRGGTSPKLIGDQYVTFFHSTFEDSVYKYRWYVFGGYTFDAKPPFCIRRISSEPIFFRGLYSASSIQPSWVSGRIAFPAGLELGRFDNKDAFIVSYGDSDAASKIVIIDQQKFLDSLVEVN